MAINFVAYIGELIVATAPPAPAGANAGESAEEEAADAAEAGDEREPIGLAPGREPIPLRPELEQRQAA
jgi:hypothetical protein